MEISILQDKLAASQEAWEASKQELHHLKRCSNELDGSLKNSIQEARTAQSMLSAFKEQIAVLLHSSSVTVKSSEEAILERIRAMSHSVESKKTVSQELLHLLCVRGSQTVLHVPVGVHSSSVGGTQEKLWSVVGGGGAGGDGGDGSHCCVQTSLPFCPFPHNIWPVQRGAAAFAPPQPYS